MTDEEIVKFCIKKTSVEIEEELEELSLENETKKKDTNFSRSEISL